MLTREEFKKLWYEDIAELTRGGYFSRDVRAALGRHDPGFIRPGFNYETYYKVCFNEYWREYEQIETLDPREDKKFCDIGGLIGIWALVMADLGYPSCMIEAVKYYEKLGPLYEHLSERGVKIIDGDIFEPEFIQKHSEEQYDILTAHAVIEHYPYSLRTFFANLKYLKRKSGMISVVTPNAASLDKRINLFFRGKTFLAPIREIWDAPVPFTGHCHEMTMAELEELGKLAGLRIKHREYVNDYDMFCGGQITGRLLNKAVKALPRTRQSLFVIYK